VILRSKVNIGFIIFFLIVKALYAAQVDARSISKSGYYIQVGAYKKVSSIQKVMGDLEAYDTYLEPYKDLYRVKIVNILTKEQLKKTLRDIRKVFPKAFVTKRVSFRDKKGYIKDISNKSFKSAHQKNENTKLDESPLDSNSILKTRKSFL
jgi:hypothetical protein